MDRLTLILGSGFSYNAGLPLAKDINSYFNRDNRKNLLHFPSDEWKWYDLASNVYKNNGSLMFDHIAYGYILNELFNQYTIKNSGNNNYESFYQFIVDEIKNDDFLELICKNAHFEFDKNENISKKNRLYEDYTNAFCIPQRKQILNMINYLISDLLYCRELFNEFSPKYEPFLCFLSKFQQKDIITLNHDLLLEELFINKGIEYCDGFSIVNSQLQTSSKKKIKCFDGIFNSETVLIKLHGSIDLYKFECAIQEGVIHTPTEEYIYFKTHDYYEKQHPLRIDLRTGEIIQNIHWNITPQFITGTNKEELIRSDKMYKMLYDEFKKRIGVTNVLLIIGYSFMDEHVNNQIISALSTKSLKKIININPSKKFPYKTKDKIEIINMSFIEEIK